MDYTPGAKVTYEDWLHEVNSWVMQMTQGRYIASDLVLPATLHLSFDLFEDPYETASRVADMVPAGPFQDETS